MDLGLRGRPPSCAGAPPESASASRRRSPRRARTSHCSHGAPTCSSARRSGSAPSPCRATSRAPTISSGSSGRTVDAFGGVDILVNNSGGPPRATAREVDADNVLDAVRLLLVSAVRLTSLCLPHLEQSAAGRIVNVTSSSVREPIESLALSNTVRPGRRRLGEDARPRARAPRDHRELHRAGPHRHRADPRGLPGRAHRGRPRDDPAPAARDPARGRRSSSPSCARTGAAYVTGALIAVDGGLTRGLL